MSDLKSQVRWLAWVVVGMLVPVGGVAAPSQSVTTSYALSEHAAVVQRYGLGMEGSFNLFKITARNGS